MPVAVHVNVEFLPRALCDKAVVDKLRAERQVTSWKKQGENVTLTWATSSHAAFLLESQGTTLQSIWKTIFAFYPTKAAPSSPES
jgi:hypothetical protein